MRVAPKLRTRRGGPRLGQHANTLKHTGKTTLEVFDGTLLERHSCTRALEPVLAHVTREDEEHDRDRIARGRCDWQEIVGHNNSACGAVSFGEAGQAHGLLVNESGRAPGTQPGSIIISTRLCLDPLRGGTGVALTRWASLSASLKTAFLAYARACARVRGGPNSRGGVKAVAPRTATRRRATTVCMNCGVLVQSSSGVLDNIWRFLLGLTPFLSVDASDCSPHPWFEERVAALQIELMSETGAPAGWWPEAAKCTTRQEMTNSFR